MITGVTFTMAEYAATTSRYKTDFDYRRRVDEQLAKERLALPVKSLEVADD